MSSIARNICARIHKQHTKYRFTAKTITLKRFFSDSSINYEAFLTNLSTARRPSAAREVIPLLRIPGMISLAAGTPNPRAFPIKSLSFQVPKNPSISDNTSTDASNYEELSLSAQELDVALQYSPSNGVPALVNFLKQYHLTQHRPPYVSVAKGVDSSSMKPLLDANDPNFDLIVSTGSQDILTRVITEIIECDSDTMRKDTLIIEAPSYSGTLAFLKPYYDSGQMNVKSVEMDNEGMIPSQLEDSIKSIIKVSGKPPKMIYLIPTGHNPGGISYSNSRKREIYDIASKYNILILEDDPYYALQFNNSVDKISIAPETFNEFSKSFDFRDNISFQSIDNDGRVIRCDSFSKIMSSGMRIGYATGPSKIINQIILNAQATHLHTSGISQVICGKLFEYWGNDLLHEHTMNVAYLYCKQRDLMQFYLNKYLSNAAMSDNNKKSRVKWDTPIAGMFYWLNLENCYDSDDLTRIEDTQVLIKEKALKHKVLMLPGKAFYVDSEKANKSTHVRVGFSLATEEQIEEGIKRFANLLA